MCMIHLEMEEHIISRYQILAGCKYLLSYTWTCISTIELIFKHDLATILWDFLVITYKHISCNRSNVIIQQKEMPSDCNIQKKTKQKISKYTDLLTECQRMWNKKV